MELGCSGIYSPHLGSCYFFAGEHEEDIAGIKQRKGQVQEGEVLAQQAHRLKCEHRAPWVEEREAGRGECSRFWEDSPCAPYLSV